MWHCGEIEGRVLVKSALFVPTSLEVEPKMGVLLMKSAFVFRAAARL